MKSLSSVVSPYIKHGATKSPKVVTKDYKLKIREIPGCTVGGAGSCSDMTLFSPSGAIRLYESLRIEAPVSIDYVFQEQDAKDQKFREVCMTITGRGLSASCYRGNLISTTVRTSNDKDIEYKRKDIKPFFANLPEISWPESHDQFINNYYHAPTRFDESKRDQYAFSLEMAAEELRKLIWAGSFTSGLIVVAGGTGSGKSVIARSLIGAYLEAEITLRKEEVAKSNDRPSTRRLHLLTVENPIEKFLFSKAKKPNEYLDPAVIQAKCGIDYTPRQIPDDTPSLRQALNDALRQTTSVVYVGEMRTSDEFRAATDFAGTGQLAVATMHAGSVREALLKLIKANHAKSPSEIRDVATRVRAVIHLEAKLLTRMIDGDKPSESIKATVPSLWLGTDKAVNDLISDGPSSITPGHPRNSTPNEYGYGKAWFLEKLLAKRNSLDYGNIQVDKVPILSGDLNKG